MEYLLAFEAEHAAAEAAAASAAATPASTPCAHPGITDGGSPAAPPDAKASMAAPATARKPLSGCERLLKAFLDQQVLA
jgi:hypothetical protein